MKVPRKSKTRINPDEGEHVGRCIRIVDMGTQHSERYGNDNRKVALTFELSDQKAIFDEDKGEQPFIIGREFTMLMTKKSGLRKFLFPWVGEKIDDDEFDLKVLLGKACRIFVKLDSDNDDKIEYANLDYIRPLIKGTKVPKNENDLILFDLDEFSEEVYDSLHDWEREKIGDSPEFLDMAEGATKETEIGIDEAFEQAEEADELFSGESAVPDDEKEDFPF